MDELTNEELLELSNTIKEFIKSLENKKESDTK